MNSIIWWVGFIVILLAILSFLGLRSARSNVQAVLSPQ